MNSKYDQICNRATKESAVVAREAAAGVVGEVLMAAIVDVTAATGPTATATS